MPDGKFCLEQIGGEGSNGGVPALVFPGQVCYRTGIDIVAEMFAYGVDRGVEFPGAVAEDRFGLGGQVTEGDGATRFDNTAFFGGDFLQSVTQHFTMIEADGGDD